MAQNKHAGDPNDCDQRAEEGDAQGSFDSRSSIRREICALNHDVEAGKNIPIHGREIPGVAGSGFVLHDRVPVQILINRAQNKGTTDIATM